jgi:hypothetical protein
MVNVLGLPYVIPDSMPPTGEESMSSPALTGRAKERALLEATG